MTTIALNYNYMLRLKMNLEKFQSTGKFDHFGNNSDFFNDAFENLKVKVLEVQ
jgi:CelD/BcsL family acetyltransferase involved in cellulose biosynthesis